jgi:hypothetical protein
MGHFVCVQSVEEDRAGVCELYLNMPKKITCINLFLELFSAHCS